MGGWEGCESVSAGKVNPEGGGPASWCDKKVATTPRWGIRTRSDAVLWHRSKHDFGGGCGIEVVGEEVSAEKGVRPFLASFCCLGTCGSAEQAGSAAWSLVRLSGLLGWLGRLLGVLLFLLYATSQPLAPVALQGDRCTEDLFRATRPGK